MWTGAAGAASAGWWTRSAGSTRRSRSRRSAPRFPPTRTSSWWSTRAAARFYEALSEQFGGSGSASLLGALGGRSVRRAIARGDRAGAAVPTRRAARADAVCVCEVNGQSAARVRASPAYELTRRRPDSARCDDASQHVAELDLDLHPLLRLRHVGGEEAVAALVEQLGAERLARPS